MERAIEGFHCDDEGDWVAHLACGHRQHVRHRPPFQVRSWVIEPEGRQGRIGTPLDCPLCDRAELPDDLEWVRSSDTWTEESLPAGLRRAHRLGARTWGRLTVESGHVRFLAEAPDWDREPADLVAGDTQAIPPGMPHHLDLSDPASLHIDFYRVPEWSGGEACFAHLVCDECGRLIDREGAHRPECSRSPSA